MSSSQTSSFDCEYQALKTGRAVVELTGWSSISVTGADRQAFLHNFCTNDVKRLTPGNGCEAFFTNVKGKIVGHGWLHCRETEIAFVGVPDESSRLIAHLDRYIIREDVQLRNTTGERSYLLVVGDAPAEVAASAITWDLLGRTDSRLLEVTPGDLHDVIHGFVDKGFISVGAEAFTAARIEAETPYFGTDFNEENLPQEVARESKTISFTKGCYLGQETVARIDALGHVNQQIVGVRFFGEQVQTAGTELTRDGRAVGAITSAAFSPRLQSPIALAMVRREAISPGTKLESPIGECEVVALPLAK